MNLLETSTSSFVAASIGGIMTLIIKQYGPELKRRMMRRPADDVNQMLSDYKQSINEYFSSIRERDRAIKYLDRRKQKLEQKYDRAHQLIEKLKRINEHEETQIQQLLKKHDDLTTQYKVPTEINEIEKEIEDLDNDDQ